MMTIKPSSNRKKGRFEIYEDDKFARVQGVKICSLGPVEKPEFDKIDEILDVLF